MTLAPTPREDRFDDRLLDEEVWDESGRFSDLELLTHGSDGWRRNRCDLGDPEDDR